MKTYSKVSHNSGPHSQEDSEQQNEPETFPTTTLSGDQELKTFPTTTLSGEQELIKPSIHEQPPQPPKYQLQKLMKQQQERQQLQQQQLQQQFLEQQQQEQLLLQYEQQGQQLETFSPIASGISNSLVSFQSSPKTLHQDLDNWGKVNQLLEKKSFPSYYYKNYYDPGRTGQIDQTMTASDNANSVATFFGTDNVNTVVAEKQAYQNMLNKHADTNNNLSRMQKSLKSSDTSGFNGVSQPQTQYQSNLNSIGQSQVSFPGVLTNIAKPQNAFHGGSNSGVSQQLISNSAGKPFNTHSATTNNKQVWFLLIITI